MTINFNDEMEPRKLCVTFKFVDVEYFLCKEIMFNSTRFFLHIMQFNAFFKIQ